MREPLSVAIGGGFLLAMVFSAALASWDTTNAPEPEAPHPLEEPPLENEEPSNITWAPEPELPYLIRPLPPLNTAQEPDDTVPCVNEPCVPFNTTPEPEPEAPYPILPPPPETTPQTPDESETGNTTYAPEPELPYLIKPLPPLNTTQQPDDTVPLNKTSSSEPDNFLTHSPEITTPTPEVVGKRAGNENLPLDCDNIESTPPDKNSTLDFKHDIPVVPVYPPDFWDTIDLPGVDLSNYTSYDFYTYYEELSYYYQD